MTPIANQVVMTGSADELIVKAGAVEDIVAIQAIDAVDDVVETAEPIVTVGSPADNDPGFNIEIAPCDLISKTYAGHPLILAEEVIGQEEFIGAAKTNS